MVNWPLRIAVEYAVIAACLFLSVALPDYLWFPLLLVVGTRQHALSIIGHWGSHGLLHKDRRANLLLTRVCLIPLGIAPKKYIKFHGAHHTHLGTEEDPEVLMAKQYEPRWRFNRWYEPVLDVLGFHADEAFTAYYRMASVQSVLFLLGLSAILVVLLGPAALIYPLAIPTGMLLAYRLRLRREHDPIHHPGVSWLQAKPSLFTGLFVTPHFTWLHYEHHAHPTVRVWEVLPEV